MSQQRQNLINDLVADLKPVKSPGRIASSVLAWLAIGTIYSIVAVFVAGPLREGALSHLLEFPLFGGETLLAVVAICVAAIATLRLTLPGRSRPSRALPLVLVPLAAWVSVYVIGLWHPVHPVSTLGARNDCLWQVFLFSLPSLAVLLFIARRQYPLWPRMTGLLAGIAAAAIPAELMQFGCMYVPSHILTHHLGPIVLTAILGALISPLVLRTRRVVPRHPDVSIH
jgi:hypothetical protein